MALHRKPLERRTYSQDRYYALIKRQKSGKATFKELTELDEIVNRVPDIRDIVIRESFMVDDPDMNEPTDNPQNNFAQQSPHRSWWTRVKEFMTRVFTTHIFVVKRGNSLRLKAIGG
jgi:hypothetical protein